MTACEKFLQFLLIQRITNSMTHKKINFHIKNTNDLYCDDCHLGISCVVFVLMCTVVALYCFVMCVCVCGGGL